MKPLISRLAVCCVLGCSALAAVAGGSLKLTVPDPDKFTDLRSTWLPEKSLLDGLCEHLQRLAEKYLPEGQVLQIDLLDIDLAGSIEYPPRLSPIRVMRDITPPRITLRYRLESSDAAAPMTEVTLRDMAYLVHINHYADGDPLRFEKQMLDDWFRRTFAAPK